MTEAPAGTTKKLFAQITKDITKDVYVTDNVFVSDISLVAVRMPNFSAALDYSMDKILISGNENSGIFVFEYHLSPSMTKFHSGEMSPTGMIQWDDRDPAEEHATHVGHAGPGESDYKYNSAIVLGSLFQPVKFVSAVSPGKITLILQGDINIPYHSTSALAHNGPCRIEAIDSNGNTHALQVKFKGETGFENRVELMLLDG
jgi:hypothetical protein